MNGTGRGIQCLQHNIFDLFPGSPSCSRQMKPSQWMDVNTHTHTHTHTNHQLFTIEQNKKSLIPYDDKHYLLDNNTTIFILSHMDIIRSKESNRSINTFVLLFHFNLFQVNVPSYLPRNIENSNVPMFLGGYKS